MLYLLIAVGVFLIAVAIGFFGEKKQKNIH